MFRPVALLFLAGAAAAPAADLPRFRGPDGSGVSPETGLPVTWSAKENVAWKADLYGPGASSPVFFGDKIFITCWTGYKVPGAPGGTQADLRRHLVCLDRKTGAHKWTKDVAARLPELDVSRDGDGYASNTPAADADRVYCFFGKSGVVAFDHGGKQLWTADVGDRKGDWGSSASPVLYGDLVIVNASIESESVVALSRADGKEKWRVKNVQQAWNTPLVVKAPGGKDELVIPAAKKLIAVDPATGAALWTCDTDITWYMVPSPVAHDGVVYCLGGRSGVVGLAARTGGTGDVTKTHRLWTSKKGSNVSSPVYHDGHLYWMNDASGTAFCARAATGEIVYEERVPRAGGVYASALLADGRIYYVGREGRTYVVAAKPKYELLATNDLGDRSNFDATPVAADGRLFIRSGKALYSLGK
ncbi:Pyrrolo-quinoline quinone OS=Pirellula staleyi (strain ATCC 27377 / DSM 6068 / ICPB 4128) GN=Psta_2735 PE=4 SV=1: PQQ_2 [Gemmataceae bacterium]|nr:Pyrrolo-quinoline quinone OS=Pirellula staleyi (strain ATCC 27377 / DSM 6068 / ICPB 4128) GN=Psta_2735 PE=4 SV=1: PQQ_2 [Gemmataceae bacterium]VTT97623.1 Pyrrolo-quinoline quinone OS=Pirellula staleyi (strain ATCC 27377 / DSM 6068 / ICPB 4128) GN=Psta_2735 PE=4 SV=1: PQQ_2 [Gemmataceae bacterium]